MNNQWLTIERVGNDVVLKRCSSEASGMVIIPDEVTHFDTHAFVRTNINSIAYRGVTFECQAESSSETFYTYDSQNNYCNKIFNSDDNPDKTFIELLQNFLSYKTCLLNILKGEYNIIQTENAYYYLEAFLYEHYKDLSDENKVWAERFMEHFSKSSIAGPSYPVLIMYGEIKKDMRVAAQRLAAAVYNLSTPWGDFAKYNCIYLARLHQKIVGVPKDQLKAESAALLFRHKDWGGPAHSKELAKLGVDIEEIIKNDFKSYYEDYFDLKSDDDEDIKSFKRFRRKEGLNDMAVQSILSNVAADICKRIVSEEDLKQTPFAISLLEYFSNPQNYPSIDSSVVGISKQEEKQETEEDYFEQTLKALEHAHTTHLYRIHFKPNAKFQSNHTGIFYMGFSDGWSYTIRERMGEEYKDSEDPIVITYPTMRDVLLDGWAPD